MALVNLGKFNKFRWFFINFDFENNRMLILMHRFTDRRLLVKLDKFSKSRWLLVDLGEFSKSRWLLVDCDFENKGLLILLHKCTHESDYPDKEVLSSELWVPVLYENLYSFLFFVFIS